MEIPEKLLPLIEKKKRFKVCVGGRGAGKSQTFCDIAIMDSHTRGLKIAFFREFQNSIEDSSFSLLCDEIKRLDVQGFNIKASSIEADGEDAFKFRGLARNAESIKSMHGFDRFIVDEAQTISFQSLKILTPTLRTEESEIWFSGNPGSSADPFSQRFIKPFEKELRRDGYYEDDMHLIIWINYDGNPFFPEVLEQERVYDKQHMTEALYNHVWEGAYYDSVDNCLIPTAWFDAAIDAHIKKGFKAEGAIVAAHDPSDEGPDSKGYCLRHGSIVLDIEEKEDGDINQGGDWAVQKAVEARADLFVFDCDGMGIGLKRQIDNALNGKKMDYFMFKGSEAAENPNHAFIDTDNPSHRNRKTNKDSLKNKRALIRAGISGEGISLLYVSLILTIKSATNLFFPDPCFFWGYRLQSCGWRFLCHFQIAFLCLCRYKISSRRQDFKSPALCLQGRQKFPGKQHTQQKHR